MKKLLTFLKSNQAVLIGAILALSTQLWHSVEAFVKLDVGGEQNRWNYVFGIMFSFSTSFAILLFTVRGRKGLAYFFLAVEVFINLIHYSVLDMPLGPILMATLFMCLIVPVTISMYSAEINPEEDSIQNVDISNNINTLHTQSGEKPKELVTSPLPQKRYDEKGQILLNEVTNIVGFDINDPNAKSKVSPEKTAKLRDLWDRRNSMSADRLKAEAHEIMQGTGPQLFKNL